MFSFFNYLCPHATYFTRMKILMVCLGNICRSPLAEGILKQKAEAAGLNWVVESAGTNGLHTGEAPHHLSQKIARQNGINISTQTSRKFTAEDFDRYDFIYAMAEDVLQDIKKISGSRFKKDKADFFLNAYLPGKNEDVPDPWFGGEDGYIEVFNLINKTCVAIVEKHLEAENKKQKV